MKKKTRKEREIDFIKLCLLVVAILLIAFTITMIRTFWMCGSVPDTLVTCFFATFSFEIIGCVCIKVFKMKYPDKKKEENEDGENFG